MDYIQHTFRASETIDAVLKLRGRHDYTQEELVILRAKFNEVNGLRVPRAGDTFLLPVLHTDVVRQAT